MSNGIKISELDSGGNILGNEEIPVARGSATVKIPASQFVVSASTIGDPRAFSLLGVSTASTGKVLNVRSLSAVDGISIENRNDTLFFSTSGQNPIKTSFTGDGATVIWTVNGANSVNTCNYRVTIDGVVQEPSVDYTINTTNSTITFTTPPPKLSKVVIVTNNLVRAFESTIADKSVTNAKLALDGGAFGFRNKIINGDMRIDQRNVGAAIIVDKSNTQNNFCLDRFKAHNFSMGTSTIQQVSDAPPGFAKSLKYTVNTASGVLSPLQGGPSGVGPEASLIWQYIEGQNIVDFAYGTFAAKTTTLSFWVKASIAGTYAGSIVAINGTYTTNNPQPGPGTFSSYIFNYDINSANTWTYVTVTIPGNTFLSPNIDTTAGLAVIWDMGSSSFWDSTTAPNTKWINGDKFFTSNVNTVKVVQNVGATFQITGVQLEVGPTATPFEYRPIGLELALCQRYYEKVSAGNIINNYSPSGYVGVSYPYKVTKRNTPLVTGFTLNTNVTTSTVGAPTITTTIDFINWSSPAPGTNLYMYLASAPASIDAEIN
jgi:archaellum component FlaF (FlaF/FlaG flagellin family)